ncbi:ArsR family transcriptional regulator [Cellulomonas sp. WB94]|uniref:helix-turn-helix transcriptional regulator n=1 Tax=Cellulomonas sp. WB94 TaxID=2173174 RepID=UPI000D5741E3|nr:helix-turn-helix domain-containing protein [Cellulomonas sp. WB94]PVU81171.1 ArsR family transcriptional regulator [Cellulomonas sp. WB94]
MPSEPIDLSSHKALAGVSRVAIVEVLRAVPGAQDVQAIAAQIGLHPNTVRTHLDQLVEAGLVDASIEARTTPGRPRVLFRASAAAPAAEADSYKLLAGILASTIDAGASVSAPGAPTAGSAAAEAGRRWGRTVVGSDGPANGPVDAEHGVARIVALLDEVGFAPRVSASLHAPASQDGDGPGVRGTVIELHRCPFREVAVEHSDVVCGVHLGLMQGALEQMGAPHASIRLEPFVRPGLCLAHVSPAGTTDAAGTGGAA